MDTVFETINFYLFLFGSMRVLYVFFEVENILFFVYSQIYYPKDLQNTLRSKTYYKYKHKSNKVPTQTT